MPKLPTRGCLTLTFDDGYQKIFTEIVPLLDKHKLPAVFATPLNTQSLAQETKQDFTPWPDWLALNQDQHEIAAHSIDHTDLPTLDDEALKRALREPAEELNASTLVYPGGAHNQRVVDIARRYYNAARSLERGFNPIPLRGSMRLKTFNYTRDNFSPLKANVRVFYAWLTNTWLIETYHLIDETIPITHSVKLSDFKKHLEFISHLPIPVKTIRQVVS